MGIEANRVGTAAAAQYGWHDTACRDTARVRIAVVSTDPRPSSVKTDADRDRRSGVSIHAGSGRLKIDADGDRPSVAT